jgi:glycosyltransferase involved in cell wall biosynthesis
VDASEIRDVEATAWPAIPLRLRLAWAGRLAPGKGLEVLVDALGILVAEEAEGHRVELVILGDGPARASLEARATRLGVGDRIHWLGFIADRPTYLDALASCDLFVFPSPAEGFPKVVLDAMAVGLPVIASGAGSLAELNRGGIVGRMAVERPAEVAAAVGTLARSPVDAERLRRAGNAFVTAHTRSAEAARLVARFPTLSAR